MQHLGAWATSLGLLSVAFPTQLFAEARPPITALRVETVIVRPIRSDGLKWDGVDTNDIPAAVSQHVQSQVRHWVEREIGGLAVGASLAAPAAQLTLAAGKWFNNAIAPPDPVGEVRVDGHIVATLPLLPNTLTPTWPNIAGRYVPASIGSIVSIKLWDSDASGQHDPIGACEFVISATPLLAQQRLTSRACTGDLLATAIVLAPEAPPRPMVAGTYRIAMARAGIQPVTPAGIPWDVSGEPDPQIRIEVDGQTLECPVTQGQLASICEPTATPVNISATTTITFRVKEADALVDDVVGGASATNLLMFESGRPIPMAVSDSVTWAELVLEPVSAPEPPASAR